MNHSNQPTTNLSLETMISRIDDMRRLLNGVLLGKTDVIERVLACLLARGHLLFDDLPGLGKTTLAKAIAAAVGGKFGRVQCTPDLLPTDITGFNIFNQKSHEFEFVPGPVFADVLLADEVNRTTPRTQSALFEAMAERQVTIDSHTRRLSETFFVVATQNPIESYGTYPLPEAQLDRFTMKLQIGLPGRETEIDLLASACGDQSHVNRAQVACLAPGELQIIQQHVRNVALVPTIREYLVDLANCIRQHPNVRLGISPRGLLIWQAVAQAWALLHGRDFVTPDDIQAVAIPVIGVRIGGEFESPDSVILQAFDTIPVPRK